MGDGTSIVPARSQGIPVRYAATIYAKFPSVVFAKASSGITTPADLAGPHPGHPGQVRQQLDDAPGTARLGGPDRGRPDDHALPHLRTGRRRRSPTRWMPRPGFANNEPVLVALQGDEVSVLRVDDIVPLPGPGPGRRVTPRWRPSATRCARSWAPRCARWPRSPTTRSWASMRRSRVSRSSPPIRRRSAAILDATIAGWSSAYTDTFGLGAIDRRRLGADGRVPDRDARAARSPDPSRWRT